MKRTLGYATATIHLAAKDQKWAKCNAVERSLNYYYSLLFIIFIMLLFHFKKKWVSTPTVNLKLWDGVSFWNDFMHICFLFE